MGKNYGLTNTELEIMEYLWSKGEKVSFRELCEYFQNTKEKNWKKQTLNTYLSNLKRAGIIGVDQSGTRYAYYPLYSKDQLVHSWTKNLVKETFDNSLANLVAAFTGGKKLSKEDADEIRKIIDD